MDPRPSRGLQDAAGALERNLTLRRRCANDGAASLGSEGNTAAGGLNGDPERVSGEGKK